MKTHDLSHRLKSHRQRSGLTQEQLAQKSGLNLRTIQRVEKGETFPRGNTLRMLAVALDTSPDELINWKTREDDNVLRILNLSQFSFLAFPILGVLLPLMIWLSYKDKVRDVDRIGKAILNFQISWVLTFFLAISILGFLTVLHVNFGLSTATLLPFIVLMYGYNLFIIALNALFKGTYRFIFYQPAIRFLI